MEPDRDLAQLAAAAQAGERTAFEELVQRCHRLVFKIAFHKTSHRTDAEDVTQEVFLHAFRSLGRLREPQAFLSWLIAIAHNRANRFCRSRQSRRRTGEEARQQLELEKERQDRELTRSEEPAAENVRELVRALPEEYRQALTWKYLDGFSYEEIGKHLSLSFNQVDYLLRRAKKALRGAMQKDRGEVPLDEPLEA